MHIAQRLFRVLGATAFTVFAGAYARNLHAQQSTPAESQALFFAQSVGAQPFSAQSVSAQPVSAQPVSTQVLDFFALNEAPDALGYSSSAGASETAAAEGFHFNAPGASSALTSSTQPPPRRYGRRPVYADSSHNADGSNKYTFFGGAGFTVPTGGTHAYDSTSYNFQVGGGRQFNTHLALLAQFDYARFGLQTNTLNSLLATYQNLCGDNCTGSPISEIGGSSHVWSFTVDPMYTFIQGERSGAYVIGGAGFYHKVTVFTTPGVGEYCPYIDYCVEYTANEPIDTYVSNSVGFNGGVGYTYKPSRFGNEKFYAEARYVYTANSRRPYYDGTTTNPTSNANYFNVFPENSARTTFIPVTFGVRF